MFMNIPGALLAVAPVSLLSGAVAFWSGKQPAERYQVPVKGAAARIVMAAVFTIGGFIFGLVAAFVYPWVAGNWPGTAPQIYLGLGVGLAVLFTIMAVVERAILKKGAVVAWTVLNFLWGVGYGALLPLLVLG